MSSTYAGAWRRTATGTRLGGAGGGYGRGPADPVDAAHGAPPQDPAADPNFAGPPQTHTPDELLDAMPAWDSPRVPGAPIDHSAGTGHDQGLELAYGSSDARADRAATAIRSRDAGAARARQHLPRSADDAIADTERRSVPPINAGSLAQLNLHRLSRPENTVDSTNGHEIFRWVARKFGYRWRRPDMMPWRSATADVISAAPPIRDGNQYTSPYGRLVSMRTRQQMTPQVRRVPRPWDEEIVVDGTDAPHNALEFQPWGL